MTANTTASKKSKGTRLEKEVAKAIEEKLQIRADRMPMSGAIDRFKGDIFAPQFPYTIECKNNERHQLWKEWQQAVSQSTLHKPPMLVVSSNHKPTLALLELNEMLNILAELIELRNESNKNPQRFSD